MNEYIFQIIGIAIIVIAIIANAIVTYSEHTKIEELNDSVNSLREINKAINKYLDAIEDSIDNLRNRVSKYNNDTEI